MRNGRLPTYVLGTTFTGRGITYVYNNHKNRLVFEQAPEFLDGKTATDDKKSIDE